MTMMFKGATAKQATTLVELLVWTYQRQRADVMTGKGLEGIDVMPDGDEASVYFQGRSNAETIMDHGRLGTIIPDTGWRQRPVVHSDAELVNDLVVEMGETKWVGAMLLRRFGLEGGHPHWDVRQHLEPVVRNGRPEIRQIEVVRTRYRNRETRDVPVMYCPLQLYPAPEWLDACRGEYASWFRALQWLGDQLSGHSLVRWTVVGIGAVKEPWKA